MSTMPSSTALCPRQSIVFSLLDLRTPLILITCVGSTVLSMD
uniref:Uncharacterized protein n=1 Tax=Arundo donax TaxID=35708 RepID=A0A0A9C883_ARUDO